MEIMYTKLQRETTNEPRPQSFTELKEQTRALPPNE